VSTLDVKFFNVAFLLYFGGFAAFALYVPFRKKGVSATATVLMALGLVPQTIAIITRWINSDHVPLSNMFEYMSLMSWMAVIILLILIWRYKRPLMGSFIAPLVFMLMVTASLLPKEVSQMLVPALQSYWITIHVTLAALGSGAFVVACAVSFIYLMKVHQRDKVSGVQGKSLKWWLISFVAFPVVLHLVLSIVGFDPKSTLLFHLGGVHLEGWGQLMISLGFGLPLGAIFLGVMYKRLIGHQDESRYGSNLFALTTFSMLIAGLLAGFGNTGGLFLLTERSPLRIFEFFGVMLMILWPVFFICYGLLYHFRFNFVDKIEFNLDLLDEINYKAITLGYPLYTVGALFAGAIWAEQAWGSFWSWDPKEVGSLIIWLFYSGFLHARYNRQWKGSKAAILAVFGFLMVLLTFFGNYFFGGQHSYA
jgi:cytochrome c-type biogenesis protein CcsB